MNGIHGLKYRFTEVVWIYERQVHNVQIDQEN